jgi:hypothetical protein
MSELGALEKLVNGLTHSQREAVSLGDELLVYLLSIALAHLRKKGNAVRCCTEAESSSLSSIEPCYFINRLN